jgi:hypothetical protein
MHAGPCERSANAFRQKQNEDSKLRARVGRSKPRRWADGLDSIKVMIRTTTNICIGRRWLAPLVACLVSSAVHHHICIFGVIEFCSLAGGRRSSGLCICLLSPHAQIGTHTSDINEEGWSGELSDLSQVGTQNKRGSIARLRKL